MGQAAWDQAGRVPPWVLESWPMRSPSKRDAWGWVGPQVSASSHPQPTITTPVVCVVGLRGTPSWPVCIVMLPRIPSSASSHQPPHSRADLSTSDA
jgi:hypothetical protein